MLPVGKRAEVEVASTVQPGPVRVSANPVAGTTSCRRLRPLSIARFSLQKCFAVNPLSFQTETPAGGNVAIRNNAGDTPLDLAYKKKSKIAVIAALEAAAR